MDVLGPAPVGGTDQECYFLLVVDVNTRYTSVFFLQRKADVISVLIPWIRATRRQLRDRFRHDFPVLRVHSDRGGEFSSDLLAEFCRDKGSRRAFMLSASPQQNGIAERRIGLIMEVARTSMIHVAAPHFLRPFLVQYAAHQLSLWPCVSEPETSPTLRWTGKVGDALVFWVWGTLSLVRDTTASKLSPRTLCCVFLSFPTDAPLWQFYHLSSRRVFSSQDVTFDESVCYYSLHPHASHPVPLAPLFLGLAPSGVAQMDPPPLVEPLEISSDSSGPAKGGDPAADDTAAIRRAPRLETPPAETAGAEPGGAEIEGEGSGCVATGGAGSRGAETGGADSGGAANPCGGGAVDDPTRGSPGGGGYGHAGAGAASPEGAGGTTGGTRGAAGAGGTGAASPGGTGGATGAGGAGHTSPGSPAGAGGAAAADTGGADAARGAGVAGPGGPTGAGGAGGPAGGDRGAAGAGGTRGATSAGGTGATSPAGPRGAGGAIGSGGTGAAGAGGFCYCKRGGADPSEGRAVLQRFGFKFSSPQPTPLSTGHSLSVPPSDESVEPSGPYPELVGCLMYLMTCTRPDLAYPLSILARYVAPGDSPFVTGLHLQSWLWFVSWRSTHSHSVLGSSFEAEIYAGAMAAQELCLLTYLLTDLGERPRSPSILYVDNKAMLALCRE
ncbi:unnamed protein product [Closterium sp. NIES-54]